MQHLAVFVVPRGQFAGSVHPKLGAAPRQLQSPFPSMCYSLPQILNHVLQGTMTHMAPEVMLKGKLSRGSDVYAFGVLLWELYSGGHAFRGVPRALLGHEVAHKQRRPEFPEGSPFEYQLLACRCEAAQIVLGAADTLVDHCLSSRCYV